VKDQESKEAAKIKNKNEPEKRQKKTDRQTTYLDGIPRAGTTWDGKSPNHAVAVAARTALEKKSNYKKNGHLCSDEEDQRKGWRSSHIAVQGRLQSTVP
jgi:hypothetical protein